MQDTVKDLGYVIPAVDKVLIKQELTAERFIGNTNKAGNELYIINHHNAPNTMMEIGRLREIAFARAGGGTGQEVDIDHYDTDVNCYEQLIVYSPAEEEIVGGYRFIDCAKVACGPGEKPALSTSHYFNFSDQFLAEYLPYTIELGRSWVNPEFQPLVNPRKGLYALDNLWDGLGALVGRHPHIKYFFGKVTMYPSYDQEARDAVLFFMNYFFPDQDGLVRPIHPLKPERDLTEFEKVLEGLPFNKAIRLLSQHVRSRGVTVPPLINNYMQLSPTMKTFGTAINPDFGGVEETGILITIDDIYPQKKERYIPQRDN